MKRTLAVCALFEAAGAALAQDANAGRAVGAVTKIDATVGQIVLRTEAGAEMTVTLQPASSRFFTKPGTRRMSLGDGNMSDVAGGIGEP